MTGELRVVTDNQCLIFFPKIGMVGDGAEQGTFFMILDSMIDGWCKIISAEGTFFVVTIFMTEYSCLV